MIEFVHEKFPVETMAARRDFAIVTKSPVVENPWWFRDGDREYYALYGCIGWPAKITEKGDQLPGYAAILGILKDGAKPEDAKFLMLDEVEDKSEYILIEKCVDLRRKWGFGVHHSLFEVFYGDYRPYENVVAEYNSRLIESGRLEREAFIVSPPDDFDSAMAFDIYMGRLRAVLAEDRKRLYLGGTTIIKNKLMAFIRNDPAITALGGLIHTLLMRIPWMEQATQSVFQVADV